MTDEELIALRETTSAVLRNHASLSRDLRMGSNLHNAADWMDTLIAEVIRLRAQVAAGAKLTEVRDAALEEAAVLIEGTAYTSNGDGRTLEPVSAGLVGMDMHHATIAAAIRALIPAFADKEGGE